MDTNALATIESNPITSKLYSSLLEELNNIGQFEVEVKKTTLHVVHKRAFLGVHPRKEGLLLNIVTSEPIDSKRFKKCEQVSTNRYHNQLVVNAPEQINDELMSWIELSYSLTT